MARQAFDQMFDLKFALCVLPASPRKATARQRCQRLAAVADAGANGETAENGGAGVKATQGMGERPEQLSKPLVVLTSDGKKWVCPRWGYERRCWEWSPTPLHQNALGIQVCDKRLRQLIRLRASVIHGGAPDVYDPSKYGDYSEEFGADPIHDMELIVAGCQRLKIFADALKEHADPNAAIVAEAQAKGRFPKSLLRNSILDTPP